MPILFDRTGDRRHFLRTAALGGLGICMAGCRSPDVADNGSGTGGHEFCVALLSDTHIPANPAETYRGFNPVENLRIAIPQVRAIQPEAAVLCGDAARLEGRIEDYQVLQATLAPLAAVAPVHLLVGNHDDRANLLKVFPSVAGRPALVRDHHVTVIDHPLVRLILLDSNLRPNLTPGHLGQAQREWLGRYLEGHRDRPVALFVHHTPGDGDGELLDADRLFAVLRPHRQVKTLFYGHSHVWTLGQRQEVRLVNLPALGYNFRDSDMVGWVEARFRAVGVVLTLHAVAGSRTDNRKTFEVRWA
jgi:3',5'-cyclic AMP phosphodiesterase CpdA